MINDENFLEQLRIDNEEALEYIVDKYSNLIFKVTYSVLNKREIAKECVNDVLLKMWDNIENFIGDEECFKNWICTIAKYTAINRLRSEIKYCNNVELNEEINGENRLEQLIETREELKEVMEIIDSFKEQDREIFYRRFVLGQSLKEVGEALKIGDKYIGQRISRCRKSIKRCIEDKNQLEI